MKKKAKPNDMGKNNTNKNGIRRIMRSKVPIVSLVDLYCHLLDTNRNEPSWTL